MYVRNDEVCDYCGELAKRPRGEGVPEKWYSGRPIVAKKNKTIGTICADCQYWDFDDFCQSQRCSARYPILEIP